MMVSYSCRLLLLLVCNLCGDVIVTSFAPETNLKLRKLHQQSSSSSPSPIKSSPPEESPPEESIQCRCNEFFKRTVPDPLRSRLEIVRDDDGQQTEFEVISHLTANPSSPIGVPRPLWLVLLGSIPTGLLWYAFYKFAVEEELYHRELANGQTPRGFGGYGTVGPFLYCSFLGPVAYVLHLPGGMFWTYLGIVFIYYTQYMLYVRVNELYKEEGLEEPLTAWWCLPIFFPFDLIVGMRQAHFLSQYLYRKRGMEVPPSDPVVELFPFLGVDTLTWPQMILTPSLWLKLFSATPTIDKKIFPEPVQTLFDLGEGEKYEIRITKKTDKEQEVFSATEANDEERKWQQPPRKVIRRSSLLKPDQRS